MNTVYRVDQADVIVSLDADFVSSGPGHVRYARDFSSRRVIEGHERKIEPAVCGGKHADQHRRGGGPSAKRCARATWKLLRESWRLLPELRGVSGGAASSKIPAEWTRAVAKDLAEHRGGSLVIAGEEQPPAVHALAHAMNASLGNVGKTVYYTEPLEANPVNEMESLRELVNDINAGKVDLLLMLGGNNPVYDAPVDFDFGPALLKVKTRVHSGLVLRRDGGVVPLARAGRAFSGSVGRCAGVRWNGGRDSAADRTAVRQPFGCTKFVAVLTGDAGKSGHDIVRDYWKGVRTGKRQGVRCVLGTLAARRRDGWNGVAGDFRGAARTDIGQQVQNQRSRASDLEIAFRPDPTIFDGRFANNGWLQELPKPNTQADVGQRGDGQSRDRAATWDWRMGDYVKLQLAGHETKAGVVMVPGHADNSRDAASWATDAGAREAWGRGRASTRISFALPRRRGLPPG